MIQRRKRNSSKINLTISFVFHGAIILAVFFLAAREGMLGKKLKEITVTMVPKEKKPEPPKEKEPEPKNEPKPAELPKVAAVPAPKLQAASAPPPSVDAPPAVAPAPSAAPAFEFNDGAREVQSVSDPVAIYKGLVEHALRSRWNRPEDIQDDAFIVEVQLSIDAAGKISGYDWLKGSGDNRWDQSVKSAIASTKVISRAPPKNFPGKFLVRFDVETAKTEEAMQVSSR